MPTSRPRASDPVKLRRSTRLSLTSASPVSPPPHTNAASPASSLFASRTDWTILVVAMAVSGVVGAGFQTVALPVTNESEKFQPNTAFGKLKAVIYACHRNVARGCRRFVSVFSRSETAPLGDLASIRLWPLTTPTTPSGLATSIIW